MLAVYSDFPKSQALLVLAAVLLWGLSLFFSGLCVCPTRGPTLVLAACLTVHPRRILPCHLFVLITMLAPRRERG